MSRSIEICDKESEQSQNYRHGNITCYICSEWEFGGLPWWWETFGLSILESMACGNALIGASTGAAAEHVQNSGAGVILRKRTPEALASAIVELYRSDLSQKKTNARTYAEKFSWNDCFKRQLDLYKQIYNQKRNA